MFPIQDKISVNTKANLEAQFAMYAALTNKTLQSMEELAKLNISAFKASMEGSTAAVKQMLAAKDPQEIMSLVSAQTKPAMEKTVAYGTQLATIASSARSEFTKAAELQFAQVTSKVNELMDDAARKAPAGSENLVAALKSTLGNATAGYEQFSKTAKQAVEAMEATITTSVTKLAQASEKKADAKS